LLLPRTMKRYLSLFKDAWTEFGDDKAQRLGAALAYYTIFSIAPLLLIAIHIASLFFKDAQAQVTTQLHNVLGPTVAKSVTEMLKNAAANQKSGLIATIIGTVTLILGAAGVFGQLKDALNTIWNVEPKKKGGIMQTIRERFLSMGMVFGVGFLLLVSLVIDTVINALGKFMLGGAAESVLQIVQLVISFGVVTVLFALIFRYLPDAKVEWRDVWFGAAFTSFLFVIGKYGLGAWLGKGSVGSAYGAAGSLVILLVWIYWSAQILFFGAEFTQVYARKHGSRIGDDSKEKAKETGVRIEDRTKVAPAPAPRPMPAYAKSGSGAGKLAIGGAAGLFLGAIVGGVSAVILIVKSAKKLLPF
jgi:membrane protein